MRTRQGQGLLTLEASFTRRRSSSAGGRHLCNECKNTPLHWLVQNAQIHVLLSLMALEEEQRLRCPLHREAALEDRRRRRASGGEGKEAAERGEENATEKANEGEKERETEQRGMASAWKRPCVGEEGGAEAAAAEEGAQCSCEFLLDVLAQNAFGKSALSEAFNAASRDPPVAAEDKCGKGFRVLKAVLEHFSAKALEEETLPDAKPPVDDQEEKSAAADRDITTTGNAAATSDENSRAANAGVKSSITHAFNLQGKRLRCREVALDWKGPVFSSHAEAKLDDTTGCLSRPPASKS